MTIITCRAGHAHEWYQPDPLAPPDCPSCHVRPLAARNFRVRAESELGVPIMVTDMITLPDRSGQVAFIYNHPTGGEIIIILVRGHLSPPEVVENTVIIGTVSDRGNVQTPAALLRDLVIGLERMGLRDEKPIFRKAPLPDLFAWAETTRPKPDLPAPPNISVPPMIPSISTPPNPPNPPNLPIPPRILERRDLSAPPMILEKPSISTFPNLSVPSRESSAKIPTSRPIVPKPITVDYVREWEKEIDEMQTPSAPVPEISPIFQEPLVERRSSISRESLAERRDPTERRSPVEPIPINPPIVPTSHHKTKRRGNLTLGFFSESLQDKKR